jgi:transglutaminase-like putative cysteine protease
MRHIQYGFTVQNETRRTLDKVELWAFAPGGSDQSQRCESLTANHRFELLTDANGNRMLYFLFLDVPPYATKIVTVRADLLLSRHPRHAESMELDAYLKAQPLIESDDPAIRRLAGTLRSASPAETARRIFNWVASNIRHAGTLSRNRGARYALKHRKGDCTEFAALFTACCRANGIPARMVGGFACDGDSVLKAGDHHNWAEFKIGGSWLIADPQRRVFQGDPSHYVVMQVMGVGTGMPGDGLFRFLAEGDGTVVSMMQ